MDENETTTGRIGLHNLAPAAGSQRVRKRVGRGNASGSGKTSGRGQKGQKARAGSHRMRAGFEGGQNPLNMAMGKQRGPHKKTSMPMGPFRTFTHPVNLRQLSGRFESGAEVTPQALVAAGILRTLRHPVKILGEGEIDVPLTVSAHGFSAGARSKIEAAGGTVVLLVPAAEVEAIVEQAVAEAVVEEVLEEAVAEEEAVVEEAAGQDGGEE
jgi:large subunit ribosomal protein L15